MAREQTLRVAARMAFFQGHSVDAVRKALAHRPRVQPKEFKPGDMVYVYREKKSKGKRVSSRWLGPATVIGPEGSNYWVARGGRCLLAAGEHLRMAEHEEVSEALRIKAVLHEVKKALDADFEEAVDDMAVGDMEVDEDMSFEALLDEAVMGDEPPPQAGRASARDVERAHRSQEAEVCFERLAKQSRLLDDVPVSVRKHLRTHEPGEPRGGGSANVRPVPTFSPSVLEVLKLWRRHCGSPRTGCLK